MKILVIGLEGATPELLLEDERLTNFRCLMENGCYGRLESVIPYTTVPAWMCMATSQDPGALGVYGLCNRIDYSYGDWRAVTSHSIQGLAIWDQVMGAGKQVLLSGVPPSYPPWQVQGACIGCYMTPNIRQRIYTHPPSLQQEIAALVGEYPVDVESSCTAKQDWLKEAVYAMSSKHFAVLRHLLQQATWEYCQCVEIGLDRLQHGFWKFHDTQHVLYEAGNPYQEVIRDYYLYLDNELGNIFDVLDDETAVLVLSGHGAQRLNGGFCINEWLMQQGLLVLNTYPHKITPYSQLDVNWDKTKVWSTGGPCPQVFFNVKGREPRGTIAPADYEKVRDDVKAMLEATVDEQGHPLGSSVCRPEEIYRTVNHVAPDLFVNLGGLAWRALDSVGYATIHVQANDIGADDCPDTPFGSFILAAPHSPISGEVAGVHLLDMAPTLLALGGYEPLSAMQGQSLLARLPLDTAAPGDRAADEEALMRERLRGLGYIA